MQDSLSKTINISHIAKDKQGGREDRAGSQLHMSNPALNRLMRGSGLTSFHLPQWSGAGRDDPYVMFRGESYHATFSASEHKGVNMKHDYSRIENREEKSSKKKKYGDGSGSDSGSDSDDEGHKGSHSGKGNTSGKNGFPARGSDGDGDHRKNEKRKPGKKGNGPWDDKDGDSIPNKIDKK